MTKREIAELFGYTETLIHKAFRIAALENNEIGKQLKLKNNHSTRMKVMDYSLEESLFALKNIPFNHIQEIYLKENFIKRDGLYLDRYKTRKKIKLSKSARNFLFINKHSIGVRKVCANCIFLQKRKPTIIGARQKPFCKFIEKFLYRPPYKLDIYNECCANFEFSEKEPLIFES